MAIRGERLQFNFGDNSYNIEGLEIAKYEKNYAQMPSVSVTELGYTFYAQPSTEKPLYSFDISIVTDYAKAIAIFNDLEATVLAYKDNNNRDVDQALLSDLIYPEIVGSAIDKPEIVTDFGGFIPDVGWSFVCYAIVPVSYQLFHLSDDCLRLDIKAVETKIKPPILDIYSAPSPEFSVVLSPLTLTFPIPINPSDPGAPDPEDPATVGTGRIDRISIEETSSPNDDDEFDGSVVAFEVALPSLVQTAPGAATTAEVEDIIGVQDTTWLIVRESVTNARRLYQINFDTGTFDLVTGFVLEDVTSLETRYKAGHDGGVIYSTRGRLDNTSSIAEGTYFLNFRNDGTIGSTFISDASVASLSLGSVFLINNNTIFLDNNSGNTFEDLGNFEGFNIQAANMTTPQGTLAYPYPFGSFSIEPVNPRLDFIQGSVSTTASIEINTVNAFDVHQRIPAALPSRDTFESYDGGQMRTISVPQYCVTGVDSCDIADTKRVHIVIHRSNLDEDWRIIDDVMDESIDIENFGVDTDDPTPTTLCDKFGNACGIIGGTTGLYFYRGGSAQVSTLSGVGGFPNSGWRSLGHSRVYGFIAYNSNSNNFYDNIAKTLYLFQ